MKFPLRTLACAVLLAFLGTCTKTATGPAAAYRIANRNQLIGGKRALAEVGDWKLSNGLVQAIIQDVGTSRGFGAFGGSLIDVDLVRAPPSNGATGPVGSDQFTEMFPAFFLQAMEPSKIEVINDGANGQAAVLRVSGNAGEFLSVLNGVNDLLNPTTKLNYSVDYTLEPGKQYLKFTVTVTNPSADASASFPVAEPLGVITLLGEGQRLFVPGKAGFDIRFRLDDVYKQDSSLAAIPGEVANYVASEGAGVSYAVAASPKAATYLSGSPEFYPGATADDLLLPLAASSFLGLYWGKPPTELGPKRTYSYSGYIAVGAGDVAAVQKVLYEMDDDRKPTPYATISGFVREEHSLTPQAGVSVVIVDDLGNYLSQARTLDNGLFTALVPMKNASASLRKYRAVAADKVRTPASSIEVQLGGAGDNVRADISMERPATLVATIRDEKGRLLPAKISVEAVTPHVGDEKPWKFLYSLAVGERFRPTDLYTDSDDPSTRRYLEAVAYAPSGSVAKEIRPGTYIVYASRGPEYSLEKQTVTLVSGRTQTLQFVVKHELTTPGWVSADFHVHSVNSVDSDISLTDRVTTYAVEGVDVVTSTDHNFITDFKPTIQQLNLTDWTQSMIGLELTALEMGHFNGYPLKLDPGPVKHGIFEWFYRPPADLFAQLRGLGSTPDRTIVQVNHPRDSLLGYFNAFNVGSYTGTPLPPTSAFVLDAHPTADGGVSPYDASRFSLDFDVMEVMNGKRELLLNTYRIPADPPEGPAPTLKPCTGGQQTAECLPQVGEVLHTVAKIPDATQPGGIRYQLQPSFPGALDDFYTLWANGRRVIGVGASDSHSSGHEAGTPRTYLKIGPTADGTMRAVTDAAIVEALRNGEVLMSNGPFVRFEVNGATPGSTAVSPDGTAKVKISVQAASWVDINKVVLKKGGRDQGQRPEVLETFAVEKSTNVDRFTVERTYTGLKEGDFLVVETTGDAPMWPVITPYEIPSIQINDAIGTIGANFGITNKYGRYKPNPLQHVRPIAITNPVRISKSLTQSLTRAARSLSPTIDASKFVPRRIPDLRRLYENLHSDVE